MTTAENDAERDLPQGNQRRQCQRKQRAGHEKALVDLVFANRGKHGFAQAARGHGHQLHGHKIDRAYRKTTQHVIGLERQAQGVGDPDMPIARAHCADILIGQARLAGPYCTGPSKCTVATTAPP